MSVLSAPSKNSARARPSPPLSGHLIPPGDKSQSHRAILFAAMAAGQTTITGLLEGDDIMATAAAARALGATVEKHGDEWRVQGVGPAGFTQPQQPLDMGNAGTGCRLLMGALAGSPVTATIVGDESLSVRPMGRVLDPLAQMGVKVDSRDGLLPATITGAKPLTPIDWNSPVASAQIKSCIVLAGLFANGQTTITEPHLSRDHTERMLALFGITVDTTPTQAGVRHTITGGQSMVAPTAPIAVAGDPSSAMFPAIAALIVPGSRVTLNRVMGNPLRTEGLAAVVDWAGKDSVIQTDTAPEPSATITIAHAPNRHARLFRGSDMPNAIDEVPVLAVAAAYANGTTRFEDFGELRVKESDRIAATCAMLSVNGVQVEEWEDGFAVHGRGPNSVLGGGTVVTHHDHRIAMAGLVLGLAAQTPVTIDDATKIATSYPEFFDHMRALGAHIDMPTSTPTPSGEGPA